MKLTTYHYKVGNANAELWCEDVNLRTIAEEYGTPVYVYSREQIVSNITAFTESLKIAGNGTHVSYALKANSNIEILKLISSFGVGADVVSGGELLAALKAGFPPDKITFDGPGKTKEEILLALEKNIYCFNVESKEEIEAIDSLAATLGIEARISIRVNPDVDAKSHPYISTGMHEHKFGIDIHSAQEGFRFAASKKNIIPDGIHVHIGSQITDLEVFEEAARSTVDFVRDLKSDGISLEHLNFGGGQGVRYKNVVRHKWLPEEPEENPKSAPQTEDYLKRILPILSETGLRLLFEPGRAIVAASGALLTKTLYRKSNSEKTFIIVDAAMNDLIRPSLYGGYHEIAPLSISEKESETVDIVGPICESTDFLAKRRLLPKLEQGDFAAVLCAGAYGFVMSSNYNLRPRAAEVMIEGNKHRLIRKRERVEELIG